MTAHCQPGPAYSRGLFLLTVALLASASCGRRSTSDEGPQAEPPQAPVVENSGKRLAGLYSLRIEKDDYSAGASAELATVTFDESGGFKRARRAVDGTVVSEEGAYVLGTRGELVLFIEKVGGELLEGARAERYSVIGQTGSRMELQGGPGVSFILEKRE